MFCVTLDNIVGDSVIVYDDEVGGLADCCADPVEVLDDVHSLSLVGLSHQVADVNCGNVRVFELVGKIWKKQVRNHAREKTSGTKKNHVSVIDSTQDIRQRLRVKRLKPDFVEFSAMLGNAQLAFDFEAVFSLSHQGNSLGCYGKNTPSN